MPAGIEIIGGQSLTQDSKVMQVVAKVNSSAMTSQSITFGRVRWDATVPHVGCVFAVSPTPGNLIYLNMGTITESGGSTSLSILASTTGASFDLFAFKPGGGGPISNGAGIEIYNLDGALGFGSNYKPFRPLTQFEWRSDFEQSSDFFTPNDYALSYPGKRVACLVSRHARALDGEGTLAVRTTPVYSPYFSNNTSNGDCRLSWFQVGNAGKDLPYWERPGRYMFLDVTNF